MLGGEVSTTHSRENIVLKTKFLSNDLPYFAELLAEVASQTKFPGKWGVEWAVIIQCTSNSFHQPMN